MRRLPRAASQGARARSRCIASCKVYSGSKDIDETAGEVIGSGETVREDWRRHFARQAEEERTSRKGKGKSEYFVKTAV